MPKMGKYCKVYPITKLREFDKWTEKSELNEADYLYLQEDYTVTDGIFIDENTIFAEVTPEWITFCKNHLNFDAPVYETAAARPVIEQ
jgi:hypothetical protein